MKKKPVFGQLIFWGEVMHAFLGRELITYISVHIFLTEILKT
jgi:hypothetical protein